MLFRLIADVIETYCIEALIEADTAEAAEEAYTNGDDEAVKAELILDGAQYDRTILSVSPYIGKVISEGTPTPEEKLEAAVRMAAAGFAVIRNNSREEHIRVVALDNLNALQKAIA